METLQELTGQEVCERKDERHQGWYNIGNTYYCQYCDGKIIDKELIDKIEIANTVV